MKINNTFINHNKIGLFSILFVSLALAFASSNTNSIFNLTNISIENNLLIQPDSLPEIIDTSSSYEIGDTIALNFAGLDTLFVLYDDTTMAGSDTLNDTLALRLFDVNKDITITPGAITKTVAPGLFGIHIEGIFTPKHLPQDTGNVNFPSAWNWMADLKPSVLRFPGGGSSRWMHLLPYKDEVAPFGVLDPIKGYGYDIKEIIRYYDVTDGSVEAHELTIMNSIISDMSDSTCDDCNSWMNDFKFQDDFENIYLKFLEQESNIPAHQQQQYIDQFIALIDTLQNQGDYTVDVIVDLNIISESATQCKQIIDYLQNPDPKIDGGNGVTSVHVVGVEMGNECHLNWATDLMGFYAFDDYWNLINGIGKDDDPINELTEEFEVWLEDFSEYVFSEEYYNDHDFIAAFKAEPTFNMKVGIPAANLKNNDSTKFAFRMMEDLSTSWNNDLVTHYHDSLVIGGLTRYLFDAVILHTYYDSQTNWDTLATSNLCDSTYPNSGMPTCVTEDCDFWLGDRWQFNTYDDRLKDAYEAVIGLGSNGFGNFKQFIRTRYAESYDQQRNDLLFAGTQSWKKELWTTEWNMKDKNTDYENNDPKQYILSSFCNSFEHGWITHEWFLNNIKQNYASGYRNGFHTYSTFHAYGGGSFYAMLLQSDKADRINHLDSFGEPDTLNDPPYGQNLFLRKTVYYTFEMLSEIQKKNLKYLQSNFTAYAHNPNVQPTVFIDKPNKKLYIYYSNMKPETQSYMVKKGYVIGLYPGSTEFAYGEALLYNIDAQQLYSNSGNSYLYRMNICYNDSNQLHPFEIQGINGPITNEPECTGLVDGAICVTVPANSFGYIEIPFYVTSREGVILTEEQIELFPNPTANTFRITCTIPEELFNEFVVDVFDLQGNLVKHTTTSQNSDIDVSNWPSTIYVIQISNREQSFSVTKKLIKIE